MIGIGRMLVIAAAALLPSLASARIDSLAYQYGCNPGFATRTLPACEDVIRQNSEVCSEDGKVCRCVNDGPVLDWILCADALIAACEDLQCMWYQEDGTGDVVCQCP